MQVVNGEQSEVANAGATGVDMTQTCCLRRA